MKDVFYGLVLVSQDIFKKSKNTFFASFQLAMNFFVYFLKNKLKIIYSLIYFIVITYLIFYVRINIVEEEFILLTIENYNNFTPLVLILYSIVHIILFAFWFILGSLFGSFIYWLCIYLPIKLTFWSFNELSDVSKKRKEEVNKIILSSFLKKAKEKNQVKV